MECSTSSLDPIGQVHASALSWMMTSQMRTSYHTYENRTLSMLLLLDSHSNLLQFLLNKTLTRLHARQSPRCTHITAARWEKNIAMFAERIKIIVQIWHKLLQQSKLPCVRSGKLYWYSIGLPFLLSLDC